MQGPSHGHSQSVAGTPPVTEQQACLERPCGLHWGHLHGAQGMRHGPGHGAQGKIHGGMGCTGLHWGDLIGRSYIRVCRDIEQNSCVILQVLGHHRDMRGHHRDMRGHHSTIKGTSEQLAQGGHERRSVEAAGSGHHRFRSKTLQIEASTTRSCPMLGRYRRCLCGLTCTGWR